MGALSQTVVITSCITLIQGLSHIGSVLKDWVQGVKCKMKSLLIIFVAVFSSVLMAKPMTGFGANYYNEESSVIYYSTHKDLVPKVVIGDRLFLFEVSCLTDIAKQTGAVVNRDDFASWLCLTSENITYWFISDNEMGQGDLTAIAIAREEKQKGCSAYKRYLNVSVKGIPLLGASTDTLFATFSSKPEGKITQYCNDSRHYGDFTQSNCLQYYREKGITKGVIISQITAS